MSRPPVPLAGPGASQVRPASAVVPPSPEIALAAFVPSVLPPVGPGGNPASPSGGVTLAGLEALALAHNPTLAGARALVVQQEGLLRQETLLPNPTAGYLRTDADQSGQSATSGAFFSQDIVTAGKIRKAREAGQLGVISSTWQVAAQQGRVVNDVRLRFLDARAAQQKVELAVELERIADDVLGVTRRLAAAKQASPFEVQQAEIDLALTRTTTAEARHREKSARRQLANVVGVPELPAGELVGGPGDPVPDLNWDQALGRLLSDSPLVKIVEADILEAEADLRLARANAVPNMNVQVVAQRDRVLKYSSVSTLVSTPLPVFNRNQGEVLRVTGLVEGQRRELERVRLALRDQLAASFERYETSRDTARQLRADVLPKTKLGLDTAVREHAAGQLGIGQVLTARQVYAQARLALIDTVTEWAKAGVEIEGLELTGGLNPTEIGTALQFGGGMGGARSVFLRQLQQQGGKGSQRLPGALQGER